MFMPRTVYEICNSESGSIFIKQFTKLTNSRYGYQEARISSIDDLPNNIRKKYESLKHTIAARRMNKGRLHEYASPFFYAECCGVKAVWGSNTMNSSLNNQMQLITFQTLRFSKPIESSAKNQRRISSRSIGHQQNPKPKTEVKQPLVPNN